MVKNLKLSMASQHELDSEDLVIADSTRAVALAGVMGGTQTEVSGTTQRILLESAWFDPVPVRETSRRLPSQQRFFL